MADNYLEKKFEEHYKTPSHKSSTSKPKKVLRVVFIGHMDAIGTAIVNSLRMIGHKIVFLDSNDEFDIPFSKNTLTSFRHVDVSDIDSLIVTIDDMVKSWGGIDVIIYNVYALFDTMDDLIDYDKCYNTIARPFYSLVHNITNNAKSYGGRLVCICPNDSRFGLAYNATIGGMLSLIKSSTCNNKLMFNSIRYNQSDSVISNVARFIRILCDESSSYIRGQEFEIN